LHIARSDSAVVGRNDRVDDLTAAPDRIGRVGQRHREIDLIVLDDPSQALTVTHHDAGAGRCAEIQNEELVRLEGAVAYTVTCTGCTSPPFPAKTSVPLAVV
jgi:hypothetical protein